MVVYPTRRKLLTGLATGGFAGLAGCLTSDQTSESELRIAKADPLNNDYEFFGGLMLPHSPVAETLVYIADDLEAKAWLAVDWEATDETSWQFTLRDDVQFHNGDELDADLLERYFLAYDEERGLETVDDGVRAVDEMILEFELEEPNPKFPEEMAGHWTSVLHPDSERDDVIATGPYQIEDHEIGGDFDATAFADYWGGEPAFEALSLRDVQDDTTRRLELESGDVDVAVGIRSEHIDAIDENPELQVEGHEQLATFAVTCNLYNSPTDDPTFREGIQHIIDQEQFVDEFLDGHYMPASGVVPPYVSWAADDLPTYEHDLDRARDLVDDSTYDGETVTIAVRNQTINGDLLAEVIQERLVEIGVDAEVELMENSAFLDFKNTGDSQLTIESPSILDANVIGLLYRMYHTEGLSNVDVYRRDGTGIHNPGDDVDELLDDALHDGNTDALYDVQRIVREEAIVVPFYHDRMFVGSDVDVDGVDIAPVSNQAQWADVHPSS